MKSVFLFFLLIPFCELFSQEVDFSAISTSISLNPNEALIGNTDFLENQLQGKRIVLLGEMDHGDGTSFEVKSAVIKYLHENYDFNMLVFESSLINIDAMNRSARKGNHYKELAKYYIYHIWSEVAETKPLFDYINRTSKEVHPLKIVGIDPQFSGRLNEKVFLDILVEKLDDKVRETSQFKEFAHELKIISRWLKYPKNKEHKISEETFLEHLSFFSNKVLEKTPGEEHGKWKLYIQNIRTLANIKWEQREGSFAKRDKQMFENLKYWLDENPDDKIIVWAANAHIIRNDKEVKGKDSDHFLIGIKKLGDHIFQAYPEKALSIGVAADHGATLNFQNIKKKHKISKSKKGSLESHLKNQNIVLINLRSLENMLNLETYRSHMFYTNVRCTSRWSNHFDLVLFINDMKPSTPLW